MTFILEGKTWLTWYYHRVTIFWFPKKRTLGPVSVCLSECVCAKHSHLPCSANRAPSSSSLLLLAAQSSSRISRRRLMACSQSTSGSWLGPSSTAFSASASNCCTADLDTFSPTFLFQPNDAILYEKTEYDAWWRWSLIYMFDFSFNHDRVIQKMYIIINTIMSASLACFCHLDSYTWPLNEFPKYRSRKIYILFWIFNVVLWQ